MFTSIILLVYQLLPKPEYNKILNVNSTSTKHMRKSNSILKNIRFLSLRIYALTTPSKFFFNLTPITYYLLLPRGFFTPPMLGIPPIPPIPPMLFISSPISIFPISFIIFIIFCAPPSCCIIRGSMER